MRTHLCIIKRENDIYPQLIIWRETFQKLIWLINPCLKMRKKSRELSEFHLLSLWSQRWKVCWQMLLLTLKIRLERSNHFIFMSFKENQIMKTTYRQTQIMKRRKRNSSKSTIFQLDLMESQCLFGSLSCMDSINSSNAKSAVMPPIGVKEHLKNISMSGVITMEWSSSEFQIRFILEE